MLRNISGFSLDKWDLPLPLLGATRKFSLVKIVSILLLLVLLLYHLCNYTYTGAPHGTVPYATFLRGMENYAIDRPSIKGRYKKAKVHSSGNEQTEKLYTKEYLESILDIPPETYKRLAESHHGYVNKHIKDLLGRHNIATFGNLLKTSPQWKEYSGSKGYVLIGGDKYSWLAYLVVKQIRATGATFPIEVFIPSPEEYEEKFCDEALPKYNARCNLLDGSLRKQLRDKFKVGGYQYKMLAILTSQFENVMYLDSDLFPMRNVEYLFASKLYEDKGLFLWPDFWSRTTNPAFYEIAEHPVVQNKMRYSEYDRKQAQDNNQELPKLLTYTFRTSNFHDFEGSLPNPTSEAGVLLVNKTSHKRTLLLALYYNIYGPDFYYPLLTQGGAGEGDKETFIAAATVMGEPYYQTPKPFQWLGYHSHDEGKFVSKALGHFDPLTPKEQGQDAHLLFMHCSYPKYYTDWFFSNHDLIAKDGKTHIRMYEGAYENLGYDADLRLQHLFVLGLCEDYYDKDGISPEGLKKEQDWMANFLHYINMDVEINKQRCQEVYIPHLKWLKETTKYKNTLTY